MSAHDEMIGQATPPQGVLARFAAFRENKPHIFLLLLMMAVALLMMDPRTWVLLTISGLAMGAMVFLMASGMTLTFGLMNVLNLAHGAFISLGAFAGASVLVWLSAQASEPSLLINLAAILPDVLPVIGGVALEKYRLIAVVLGLAIYGLMTWIIERTRVGILIRAGVESREMVEVQGYRIRLLFLGVFVAGSALAGLGGAMWAMYREIITAHMGDELMISVIVVIILGGLGSIKGCFYGAVLVGLINLYVGYLEPRLAAVATVGLMVGVLMWRPQGLIPVIKV